MKRQAWSKCPSCRGRGWSIHPSRIGKDFPEPCDSCARRGQLSRRRAAKLCHLDPDALRSVDEMRGSPKLAFRVFCALVQIFPEAL